MNQPSIILASASPRRADLLRQMDVPFETIPSRADELHHEQLTAGELCQINAYRKARAVSKKHPDSIVMGVDTLVTLKSKIFGKPNDMKQARRMLEELQGKSHYVFTGVCLICLREHKQHIFYDKTEVTFRSLTPKQIDHYLSRINPLDKAGAYAIQEHGDDVVRSIAGSFSNVVGLPMERLRQELTAFEESCLVAH
jgi:septum formation protein